MTKSTDLLPEGLEDRLPIAAKRITLAMRACLDVLDAHGFDRVRPPLLEFESSLASRMDGIETRRMFRMTDPASLRTLALRSDITPQIGRIAATSMKDAPRPLRLAYCGDTAVMKSSQLDPARERLQLGGELIGSDTAAAAGEIVAVALEALRKAGLSGLSVDFTMPDLVDTLGKQDRSLSASSLDAIRRELDTKDAGGLKAVGGEAYLPLLYATGPFSDALTKLRELDPAGALSTRLDGLEEIAGRIPDDIRVTLDPTERHGFEYQSWFGFTIYAENVRGAAGRGGTYVIGGTDEVATGFTLYVNRMADAAPVPENAGWVIYLEKGYDVETVKVAHGQGHRTIAQLSANEDPVSFGATHIMRGNKVEPISS
ncbi:MAG: ATP phosphoribosyltransferase regulatory subunit [Pseudomonadota bacterium]